MCNACQCGKPAPFPNRECLECAGKRFWEKQPIPELDAKDARIAELERELAVARRVVEVARPWGWKSTVLTSAIAEYDVLRKGKL